MQANNPPGINTSALNGDRPPGRLKGVHGPSRRNRSLAISHKAIFDQIHQLEAEYPAPRPKVVRDRIRSLRAKLK
jgi:hypothetical protein